MSATAICERVRSEKRYTKWILCAYVLTDKLPFSDLKYYPVKSKYFI